MESGTLRLLVVEDQPKILKNQLKLLKAHPGIEIVGTAMTGDEAVKLALSLNPDVILLDLGLPVMDGIEVTRAVKQKAPKIEILIFTVFDEEDKVIEAIKAGASGYLLKGADSERIVEAIHEVRNGGSVIQPSLARRLLKHFRPDGGEGAGMTEGEGKLSERQGEILQLIAKGLSNSEVAGTLGLSRFTIRTHLEHIYQKLDVTNRMEAVTEGIRKGLIEV